MRPIQECFCPDLYTTDQVFFYPKDSTPGCTKEAQTFQADLAKFKKAGAEVIGISSDADHSAFVQENNLSMTLLSDIGGKVSTYMWLLREPEPEISRLTAVRCTLR